MESIFGNHNKRLLEKLHRKVHEINSYSELMKSLSNEDLRNKTLLFKQQLSNQQTSLDQLLPEAFATVREASSRILGLYHYDVQLMGGIVLHEGNIAEMQTGEGKTLVAALPAYLNALTGKGVHIITVNDYLVARDALNIGRLYEFLGLKVGYVINSSSREARKEAYAADIIYGTSSELCFDYLRDNLVFEYDQQVHRDFNYAIVDEVDSVLIDEATTPLIISGSESDTTSKYILFDNIVKNLSLQDCVIDEKYKQIYLTQNGYQKIEQQLVDLGIIQEGSSLYSPENINNIYYLTACLKANYLFHNSKDYLIVEDNIFVVSDKTGRALPGRRWSDGLHQAIEAKEGISIKQESINLASITLQNFFRLYPKLSGMTGTATTEESEFQEIYDLDVVAIPTNKPSQRIDHEDILFATEEDKFHAIVDQVKLCLSKKQPVLVGTASIYASEKLSQLLKNIGIRHHVLNAKNHASEAIIVAQAGSPGAVTIATNMAGRGTDIVLGGNCELILKKLKNPSAEKIQQVRDKYIMRQQKVKDVGGLFVISSERYNSRRIDNQLRGRCARQGDPGESQFFISLEDPLLKIFSSESLKSNISSSFSKGESIQLSLISNLINKAQQKVAKYYFDGRKQELEYDNIINDQRKVVYAQRQQLLKIGNASDLLEGLADKIIDKIFADPLIQANISLAIPKILSVMPLSNIDLELISSLSQDSIKTYIKKLMLEKQQAADSSGRMENNILLLVLHQQWQSHLNSIEDMRKNTRFFGYAQKDPKIEFKRIASEAFDLMITQVRKLSMIKIILWWEEQISKQSKQDHLKLVDFSIRRNELCHCGSNKKYKYCHGIII